MTLSLCLSSQHRAVVQQFWMEGGSMGKGGRREEGLEAGAGPEGLGTPGRSLHPLPACRQLSCSCHHPQSLQVFQSSTVCLSNSIFLPDKRGAGSTFPFTTTGWLSAAVASVLVRKIKKEVKEAIALRLQAGGRIWAWPLLGRPSQGPPGGAGARERGPGQGASSFFTNRLLSQECGGQCGLWSPLRAESQLPTPQLCVWAGYLPSLCLSLPIYTMGITL